jgi:hypothetical protein
MRLEGADLEGYLAHHHDMIILTSIEESRRLAEQHVQNMHRRWMRNDWESAKASFMESLGHRAHKWSVSEAAASAAKATPPSSSMALTTVSAAPSTTQAGSVAAKPLQNKVLQVHADAVSLISRASCKDKAVPAASLLAQAARSLENNTDSTGFRLLLTVLQHMVGEPGIATLFFVGWLLTVIFDWCAQNMH